MATYYINGIEEKTGDVMYKIYSWATYNLYGLDLIGQIRREGSTWNRYYFLKDHLGSIRVTVNASGNVVAYDDYYPFGALMYGRTQESSAVDGRYKYTGKERDMETRYDYFGARYYDARICRWLQVDPMAEKYPGWSPYVYTKCNPVRYIDIRGMQPDDNEERERERVRQVREDAARKRRTSIKYLKRAITLKAIAATGFGIRKRYGPLKIDVELSKEKVEHLHNIEEGKSIKKSEGYNINIEFKGISIDYGKEQYETRDQQGQLTDIHRDEQAGLKQVNIGPLTISPDELFTIGGSFYVIGGLGFEINLVNIAKSLYYISLYRTEMTKDPEYLRKQQMGGTK